MLTIMLSALASLSNGTPRRLDSPAERPNSAAPSAAGEPRAMWRLRAAGALLLVVPAGLLAAEYDAAGRWWLNNPVASVCYEVFFVLLAFVVWPRRAAIARIPLAVLVATVGLEFLQLWHLSWLQAVRATWIGQAVLGDAFSWLDLPAYPLGCWCGWLLLRRIVRLPRPA
jgi:hypothetical protein